MKPKRNSITIYPSESLRDKLIKESIKQKRSLNNLIIFLLEEKSE